MQAKLHYRPFDAADLPVARELVFGPILDGTREQAFDSPRHALGRLTSAALDGANGPLHHLLEARLGERLVPYIVSADVYTPDGGHWTEIAVDLDATRTTSCRPLRDLLDAPTVRALLRDVQARMDEVAVEAWLGVPVEG